MGWKSIRKYTFIKLHFYCDEIFNINKLEQRLDLFTFVVLVAWFLSGAMKWSASALVTNQSFHLCFHLTAVVPFLTHLNYSPSVAALYHGHSWSLITWPRPGSPLVPAANLQPHWRNNSQPAVGQKFWCRVFSCRPSQLSTWQFKGFLRPLKHFHNISRLPEKPESPVSDQVLCS